MSTMTPREIVHELNNHIVGQDQAKRSVAIALRNRWRRMQLNEELQEEIHPKNILMIGPTGVGKTEIARRLAKLAKAPFIKVEATKFTEVGYVGRDVESMIRDLVATGIKHLKEENLLLVKAEAADRAEERVLDALLPRPKDSNQENNESSSARQLFRKKLREGELDSKEIKIELDQPAIGVEIMAPPGMEEMTSQLQNMFSGFDTRKKRSHKLTIKEALKRIIDEEASNLIDEDELKTEAIRRVEQTGIVFIDELDKVAKRSEGTGADVSREGVQRDLLPIIEGSTVSTKYGSVRTNHILFIASGAFHLTKPSDLIPELQGRLPIRVELEALTTEDYQRILIEPNASLAEQYKALMATEGISLDFADSGIERIAELAWQVNEGTENIGARRLHTLLERLLENLSYEAGDQGNSEIVIDQNYVNEQLQDIAKNTDLSKYIL